MKRKALWLNIIVAHHTHTLNRQNEPSHDVNMNVCVLFAATPMVVVCHYIHNKCAGANQPIHPLMYNKTFLVVPIARHWILIPNCIWQCNDNSYNIID